MSLDTIYALSSGALPSGVAVIRMSGSHCRMALQELCGVVPQARTARLSSIRDRNGLVLDRGLVLFFPSPASFTGEDCAELQIHGGRAAVNAVLTALSAIPGLRSADAGEFSRRAFLNGKVDLTGVEGLADLIAAETEMQRRLAAEHASGGLARVYDGWAKRLTHARAMIEAELDFADEDDVPGSVSQAIWSDMRKLRAEIALHLGDAKVGEIVRDGLRIVIAGPPNAGKSSLLNHLAKRDVAIVTDIPGTTRDTLHVDLDLDGYAVRLFDTAGLRETDDVVEKEGIRRARAHMADAHLILLLSESGQWDTDGLNEQIPVVRVLTKTDRLPQLSRRPPSDVMISVETGDGIAALLDCIRTFLPDLGSAAALALPARRRHTDILVTTIGALDDALSSDDGLDMRAEHLRVAALELGRITGRVDVENLLDVIFSEFCIGK